MTAGLRRGAWDALLAVGLAALSGDVAREGRMARLERSTCRRPVPAPRWAWVLTRLGDGRLLATAVALEALSSPGDSPAAVGETLLTVGGAVAARRLLAEVVRRPRPPREWWQEAPHGWSYPSRHTANAVLLAVLTARKLPAGQRYPHMVTTCTAAAAGALVGTSRVRLGVHWPTDVLGSVLLCALWLRLTRHVTKGLRAPRCAGVASKPRCSEVCS